jgi:hypothetical protein
MNFLCITAFDDLADPGFSGIAVRTYFDLDQFMMNQCSFNFSHDIFIQALPADHHNGLQPVCQTTQVSNLLGSEWHVMNPDVANW